MAFHIFIFIVSCLTLFLAGKLLIDSLTRIARFLEWREFVVAFIIVAMAASIPNLFVGITSAVYKIPQLSFVCQSGKDEPKKPCSIIHQTP